MLLKILASMYGFSFFISAISFFVSRRLDDVVPSSWHVVQVSVKWQAHCKSTLCYSRCIRILFQNPDIFLSKARILSSHSQQSFRCVSISPPFLVQQGFCRLFLDSVLISMSRFTVLGLIVLSTFRDLSFFQHPHYGI